MKSNESKAKKKRLRPILFVLGPLLLALAGGYIYLTTGRYVETENAYAKLDILPVSANVSGRLIEILVHENQEVSEGDTLFRIDTEPFRIGLAEASAERDIARNRIGALIATHRQAAAALMEEHERTVYFELQYKRQQLLRTRGVSTVAQYDKARLDLTLARQRERSFKEKINIAAEELGGRPDLPAERHALYLRAEARRARAALDLRDTVVRAPFDGTVSNLDLQVGHHVAAGVKLFSLIGTRRVWIEANIKETQLAGIRIGQKATVVADALPDIVWTGRVESIASATGSEFALLPPQNSSGNWVKVVRRLTIRLTLDAPEARLRLRAGMSVLARIDTGRERALLRWARSIFAGGGGAPKEIAREDRSAPVTPNTPVTPNK